MANYRILVVEDEPDGREVVQILLESSGHQVVLTANAEDALRHLENGEQFDGMILDLALPGMDGFEMLRTVRARQPTADLVTVAITAFHTPELRVKAMDAGFNGYFAKPIDIDYFAGAVNSIISEA